MMLFISIRASFAGLEFLRKAFIRLDKAIGFVDSSSVSFLDFPASFNSLTSF